MLLNQDILVTHHLNHQVYQRLHTRILLPDPPEVDLLASPVAHLLPRRMAAQAIPVPQEGRVVMLLRTAHLNLRRVTPRTAVLMLHLLVVPLRSQVDLATLGEDLAIQVVGLAILVGQAECLMPILLVASACLMQTLRVRRTSLVRTHTEALVTMMHPIGRGNVYHTSSDYQSL